MSTIFKTMTVVEGLNEIPRMILQFESEHQLISIPTDDLLVDLPGFDYEGNYTLLASRANTVEVALLDPQCFNIESKYLGSTLSLALNSLNLKTHIDDNNSILNISGNFHKCHENSWIVFNRLKTYIPSDYFLVCTGSKIQVIKPKLKVECVESAETDITQSNDYSRSCVTNAITDSVNNPAFRSNVLPITSLLSKNINKISSRQVVTNYTNNKLHNNNYYDKMLYLRSRYHYDLGQGLLIGDTAYTVVLRTETSDLVSQEINYQYKLIATEI